MSAWKWKWKCWGCVDHWNTEVEAKTVIRKLPPSTHWTYPVQGLVLLELELTGCDILIPGHGCWICWEESRGGERERTWVGHALRTQPASPMFCCPGTLGSARALGQWMSVKNWFLMCPSYYRCLCRGHLVVSCPVLHYNIIVLLNLHLFSIIYKPIAC